MSPENLKAISDFLNAQANLPVHIQAIAEDLKKSFNPEVSIKKSKTK